MGEGGGSERLHAVEDASVQPSALPRTEPIFRGTRRLSVVRLDARAQSALDLREAIEIAGSSVAAVARKLGVDESVVRSWCDPLSEANPASGDLDVLPPKVRAAYYAIKRAAGATVDRPIADLARDVMACALAIGVLAAGGDLDALSRAVQALDDATLALARGTRGAR
jgi:transposase-like protein